MSRRTFLRRASGSVGALAAIRFSAVARGREGDATRDVGVVTPVPEQAVPAGKRIPFGWSGFEVPGAGAFFPHIRWPSGEGRGNRLRLSLAVDMRERTRVEVVLAESGDVLGVFDIRFAAVFQPHEAVLPDAAMPAVRRQGVVLRKVGGNQPLWFFRDGRGVDPGLVPHLMAPGGAAPMEEYGRRMQSLDCLQAFGWMEGCVLDGLLDLAEAGSGEGYRTVAHRHLDLYFRDDRLIYEDPSSRPSDDRVYGIEGTLPFAALARVRAEDPRLALPLRFWESHRDAEGAVIDGDQTTSEGAYTVGYPMALIGRARRLPSLIQQALLQVRVRHRRLFSGDTFRRVWTPGGKRYNINWARGIAWQLLGAARTLETLRDEAEIDQDVRDFQALAAYAADYQRPDGLWSVFVNEPGLTQDTAGSAGIAAALAIGRRNGWLAPDAGSCAAKTLAGLKPFLTPDGLLGGASQSNKGGESLQRSDYRVLYPMAMGLMAQLLAALEHANPPFADSR